MMQPRPCGRACPLTWLTRSTAPGDAPRRVAMISLHTSPLDQPGTGDAGGMNVYVLELSRRLAERNLEVEIYTRATSLARSPPIVEAAPGVRVHHVAAGPYEGLGKDELPGPAVHLRPPPAARRGRPRAGLVRPHPLPLLALRPGRRAAPRPLVGAAGRTPCTRWPRSRTPRSPRATPPSRPPGCSARSRSSRPPTCSSRTPSSRPRQLIDLYDADPTRVEVVHPGVDLGVFRPATAARGPRPARHPRRRGRPDVRRPAAAAQGARRPARARSRCCVERDPSLRPRLARAGRRRTVRLRPRAPRGAGRPRRRARHRRRRALRAAGRPATRSSTGTPPRRWSACRPTTSPSGWSRSRPSAVGTPVVAAPWAG